MRECTGVCKTMGKRPIYNGGKCQIKKMVALQTKIGPNQFIFDPSMHNIPL